MEEFKIKISKAADTLVNAASIYQCSIENAWDKYMHPYIAEQFSYQEVKDYIDNKVGLGEKLEEDLLKRENNK